MEEREEAGFMHNPMNWEYKFGKSSKAGQSQTKQNYINLVSMWTILLEPKALSKA